MRGIIWNITWRGPHPSSLVPVCGLTTSHDNNSREVACSAVRSITAMCLPLDIFIPYANTDPVEPVIIHQEVSPNGNCFCPAHSLFISLDGSGSERLRSEQTVSLVLLFISLSLRTGMRQNSGVGLFNSPLSSFHLFFCGIDKTPQLHSCWSHTIIRNVCIDQVPRKGSAFHR